jgi:isoleucyl-tRNA synthetase
LTVDYGKTLNLPKTEFPMRANLPLREPDFQKEWEEKDLYNSLIKKNSEKPLYILHDGPPYANGDIHLGHTLNKVLKDIIVKFKNMDGFNCPYVPGWDTHGLPIERQAIKKLKLNRHEADPVEFRKACKEFALKYVDIQKEQFKRLGILGDWDNPYLTLAPEFEAKQVEVFGSMAKKGYIYKGLKPVYWCSDCETALAEAEIEYSDSKVDSIYVKFELKDDKGKFEKILKDVNNIYFVIWTTTTWTLPGNMAVCLNQDFKYSLVKTGNDVLIIASELVERVMETSKIENYEVIDKISGSELEYMVCRHPFLDRDSLVILGDHVTLEAGTGCVHTAPGHGAEDFDICKKYNIPIVVPVDDKGHLNEEAGKFAGLFYANANKEIVKELLETKHLLAIETVEHSYPHCWRCNEPILYRATEQWFASVEGFKDAAIEEIRNVQWIPEWGEERIANMVRDRNDWCISRQRIWGVPIPIFYCSDCGKELINDETIKIVSELFKEKDSDAWFYMEADEILPETFKCDCGGTKFTKEEDIMDVWFDSGSSHVAVLETRDDLRWPADMYIEGNDQYRGWFQSSLLTSVATRQIAPYKTVVTHGFVVDGEGKKMSKSLGNGIDPLDVIKQYGADILRLWTISADYKTDVRISKDILKQLSEIYRKIRNTARFILGNISDFNPDNDAVEYEKLFEIDKWALLKVNKLVEKVLRHYRKHEYHMLYHAIHNFCVVDMSNFYLDIIKDRLYVENSEDEKRRAAQTVMYEILDAMVKLLAPVLAFTSEEIWDYMPHRRSDDLESVLLNGVPEVREKYNNNELEVKWDKIIDIREDVSKALEIARTDKVIGHSLGAFVTIYADDKYYDFLKSIENDLETIFIVSGAQVKQKGVDEAEGSGYKGETVEGITITVSQAQGEKCERCWIVSKTVGNSEEHPTLCSRCSTVISA